MTIAAMLFLAVLQGLTEFLPVSSSGHLVLGQHLLGVRSPGVLLEVALHLGTLVSVIIVFRKDVLALLRAAFSILRLEKVEKGSEEAAARRLLVLLVLATMPAVALALLLGDLFAFLFSSPRLVGLFLLVTGGLLFYSGRRSGSTNLDDVGVRRSLVIGMGQGLAIVPGISRSGATIAAALLCGLNKDAAVRFSFLLSIPAILGAAVVELLSVASAGLDYPASWLLYGVLVSAVTGILAINWLVKLLRGGRLRFFSYYLWVVGTLSLLFLS